MLIVLMGLLGLILIWLELVQSAQPENEGGTDPPPPAPSAQLQPQETGSCME